MKDDYNNIQEQLEKVQSKNNRIQNLHYTVHEITPEVVNDIFCNFVIVDH